MYPQPDNNEKILLHKIAAGDEQAFKRLFDHYADLLAHFILRYTESQTVTEEIVQDVFLKIWQKRTGLRDINCFHAYLFKAAKNHALNAVKQLARENIARNNWLNDASYHQHIQAEEPAVEENAKRVEAALRLLPPRQQMVLLLGRKQGMKQAEIARVLKISPETVKKHTLLAMRFLKKTFGVHNSLFGPIAICVITCVKNNYESITTFF